MANLSELTRTTVPYTTSSRAAVAATTAAIFAVAAFALGRRLERSIRKRLDPFADYTPEQLRELLPILNAVAAHRATLRHNARPLRVVPPPYQNRRTG